MSCEDGNIPQETKKPATPPVDPHRAFRELQRWLNIDDQMRPYSRRELSSLREEDKGELVFRIVYNPTEKTIRYKSPQAEPSDKTQT